MKRQKQRVDFTPKNDAVHINNLSATTSMFPIFINASNSKIVTSTLDIGDWKYSDFVLPKNIETLDQLIDIGKNYANVDAGINWEKLWLLVPYLEELNNLVGMKKLKRSIVDLVLYCVQGLYDTSPESTDNLHTVLCGPPGVGKTTVAHILAEIYCNLGFLKTNKVITARKSDFIGKFVGHTEPKTKELLEKANNGVLFIDEAYSFGSEENIDSFSKIIIDMLNAHLSENKHNMVCIIAGYEEELEKCFFKVNPGLKRRFPWKFVIDDYTSEELFQIFEKLTKRISWNYSEDIPRSFFNNKEKHFPYFGGDMENFVNVCKITHTRRIFGDNTQSKRTLNIDDLNKAMVIYLERSENNKSKDIPRHLYGMYG